MIDTKSYLIGELAEKAGVTVRTIRYYITEGLLPPPDTRGRYSVYDEHYLKRIDLIKRLKETFLPIKEIRFKLDTQTEEEIEEFLDQYENISTQTNPALDYIAGIMGKQTNALRVSRANEPSTGRIARRPQQSPSSPGEPTDDYNQNARWHRLIIAPGIELHVIEPVFIKHTRSILQWIGEFKIRILGESSPK